MEIVLFILLAIVVVIIGGAVAAVWLTAAGLKLLTRGTSVAWRTFAGPAGGMSSNQCRFGDCRSDNPAGARFCRRCGRPV